MTRLFHNRSLRLSKLLGTSVAALVAMPAHAQQAGPAADARQSAGDMVSQEIIVTAQKRAQRLEDVPASISVLSGSDLDRSGAQTIEDVQFKVPNLSLVNLNPGTQQYQLRGVSSNLGLPTIGVYFDEMPITMDRATSALDVNVRDMQRIEVLRGPQGTTYGEGSMGGTIRYITADPDLARFGGDITGEAAEVAGGDMLWRTYGSVNVPLIEGELGARVTASYERNGGWIDFVALGQKNANDLKRLNVRAKILWRPSSQTRASITYMRGDTSVDNSNYSNADRKSFIAIATPVKDKYNLFNGIISHDFGPVEILSSTGYIDRKSDSTNDLSFAFVPFLGLFFPPGFITSVGLNATIDYKVFTQEVRLSSARPSPFQWMVGAYLRDYKDVGHGRTFSGPNPLPFPLLDLDSVSKSKSWAVFGQGSYRVTPQIEASIGLRYYEDKRSQRTSGITFGAPSSDGDEGTFKSVNPRFSLLYNLPGRSSIYTTVAKGFRSGGFNSQTSAPGQSIPLTYDPEDLWSYEVGGVIGMGPKSMIQWAVYYNDWKNIQSFTFAPGTFLTITTNGGKARGIGFDLSGVFYPVPALELRASLGHNKMRYKTDTAEKLRGDPIDYVPDWTASAAGTYNFALKPGLDGYFRAELLYTDKFQVFIRNFQTAPARSDQRTLFNMSLGLSSGPWSARVFGENLFNKAKISMPALGFLPEPVRTPPRTLGVGLTRRF